MPVIEQEIYAFKASLDYRVRPFLKKKWVIEILSVLKSLEISRGNPSTTTKVWLITNWMFFLVACLCHAFLFI